MARWLFLLFTITATAAAAAASPFSPLLLLPTTTWFNHSQLLGPLITEDEFYTHLWQRRYCSFRHSPLTQACGPMNDRVVEWLLDHGYSVYDTTPGTSPLSMRDAKLVRRRLQDGEYWTAQLPVKQYSAATARRAFNSGGVSLVLNRMNERWPALGSVANTFRRVFGLHVQINMYFSPPRAQAFEVHFDPQEIFVIQIRGHKTWRLYQPLIMSPLTRHKFKPTRAQYEGNVLAQLRLSPGDVLYVPAGVMHEAENEAEQEPSLHLTVGVEYGLSSTIGGLLHAALSSSSSSSSSPSTIVPCHASLAYMANTTLTQWLHLSLTTTMALPEAQSLRRLIPPRSFVSLNSRVHEALLDWRRLMSLQASLSFIRRANESIDESHFSSAQVIRIRQLSRPRLPRCAIEVYERHMVQTIDEITHTCITNVRYLEQLRMRLQIHVDTNHHRPLLEAQINHVRAHMQKLATMT